MNVRKKLSEKLYFMGQSKITKKIVIPTAVTTGIVLGCSLAVNGSQPENNVTNNKKTITYEKTNLSASCKYNIYTTPNSFNDVNFEHQLDKLIGAKENNKVSTGESISEAKNIKPLATLGNLKELQRRIENEVVVSAASGSQISDSNNTLSTSTPLDNTIVSTTKPATPQGVMADAHIKAHETYMKISNLEDKVDALTDERDELKKELAKYKKEEKKKKAKKENEITSLHLNSSDVREISGANAHTLNVLLSGTYLEGYGELFYNLENKYGVNALFSIGNSILETGWDGSNWLAVNKNNIYGFNSDRYFDSKESCIRYWFDLLSEHYVGNGLISMGTINAKYCPPNDNWAYDIKAIVNKLVSKNNLTLN